MIEKIQKLNRESNIGVLFCQSRDPDILSILTSEPTQSTLSSITNMIAINRESIEQIPLQCLAQFMISTQSDASGSRIDSKTIPNETINSVRIFIIDIN